eukprot:scaffold33273_cov62-Phaeocystis_antarctica.AAC.3
MLHVDLLADFHSDRGSGGCAGGCAGGRAGGGGRAVDLLHVQSGRKLAPEQGERGESEDEHSQDEDERRQPRLEGEGELPQDVLFRDVRASGHVVGEGAVRRGVGAARVKGERHRDDGDVVERVEVASPWEGSLVHGHEEGVECEHEGEEEEGHRRRALRAEDRDEHPK